MKRSSKVMNEMALVTILIALVAVSGIAANVSAQPSPEVPNTVKKSVLFRTIIINLANNTAAIKNITTDEKTISGTNEELKAAFTNLTSSDTYLNREYRPSNTVILINPLNNTVNGIAGSLVSQGDLNTWFDSVLVNMEKGHILNAVATWTTVCTTKNCASTHAQN